MILLPIAYGKALARSGRDLMSMVDYLAAHPAGSRGFDDYLSMRCAYWHAMVLGPDPAPYVPGGFRSH